MSGISKSVLVTCVMLFVCFVVQGNAQGKKVYISVDMEGISGVVGDDQTSGGQPEYGRSRKLMAEDANAAIRGAFAGGATEVVVNDSHGSQRNLLPEDLDPRARLISHSFKRHGMVEGLDDTFDAVIFVGYHAKADSPRGLFAHTGSGVVKDVQVNGRSAGEGGLNTLMAQWFGVPVVMITGDDVAIEQQKEWTPNVRGVVVKRAINMRAVESRPLAEARREIEAAAKESIAASRKPAPALSGVEGRDRAAAYKVRMQLRNFTIAEVATAFSEITLVAPDTVEFSRATMPEAYRVIRVLYRFISPD
jgi:D-amino peptidase